MYSKLFRSFIFPLMELSQGTKIQKYLKWLEKTQWWKPEELEELQNKRLRSLIRHAYKNVPYYHRLFKELKLRSDDIKTKDDLHKLPVLTKETIRKNLSELIAKNIPKSQRIEAHSSGSTGEPLKYYIDKQSYSFGWAQTFRCWSWAGYKIGDPYVKITHPRTTYFKKIQDFLMNCTLIPAFEINENNIDVVVKKIIRTKPKIVRGFASSVYILAKLMKKEGLDAHVNAVMTTGDMLLPQYRELIESCFNCKVFDAYGGESTPVAYECEQHEGYHIASEGVIVELIKNDGTPCDKMEIGEIILTNLTNYAMPLIRYKINDLARLSEDNCSCGRGLPLIDSIEGRSTDVIITPDGRLLTVHFFSTYLKLVKGLEQYQIIQEKPEKLLIKLVTGDKFSNDSLKYIEIETKKRLGEKMDIEIKIVNSIPPTRSGKRRYVISKIAENWWRF